MAAIIPQMDAIFILPIVAITRWLAGKLGQAPGTGVCGLGFQARLLLLRQAGIEIQAG